MRRQFIQFLTRWVVNYIGLYVASSLIGSVSYQEEWRVLALAALTLSIVNALIKPLVVILSLPALLITLGLFSIIINGFMVYLVHIIYKPFEVSSFGAAILAGVVIGLVNYIVTRVAESLASEA